MARTCGSGGRSSREILPSSPEPLTNESWGQWTTEPVHVVCQDRPGYAHDKPPHSAPPGPVPIDGQGEANLVLPLQPLALSERRGSFPRGTELRFPQECRDVEHSPALWLADQPPASWRSRSTQDLKTSRPCAVTHRPLITAA